MKKWSGADMRCQKCNKYLPDRCTCNGPSIEQRRIQQAKEAELEMIEHPDNQE